MTPSSPPEEQARTTITLTFGEAVMPLLARLPWHKPLERWSARDARFLRVKSGLSRHIVRFVRIGGRDFAVKETSVETAGRELHAYTRLQALGIPCLTPAGTAFRSLGKRGIDAGGSPQLEAYGTGYVVTELLDYALPNEHLFRRAFTRGNRRRIWDVIVALFVSLHTNGVYWGDASLANMMIVFDKRHIPELGVRTVLRAVLADAETVEFYPSLSEALRRADLDYFLETMAWTEADMQAAGTLTGPLMAHDDQEYILHRYLDCFEIEREEEAFRLMTQMDTDRLIGPFESVGQSRALLKDIYEHKWYLSEREQREVPVEEAARDWYAGVFKPVLRLFAEHGILKEFPDRTAASLYLDIMLHKYLLSERAGRDVGLAAAFEGYVGEVKAHLRSTTKVAGFADSVKRLLARGGRS